MVVRIELDNIEDITSKIKESSNCAKDATNVRNYDVPYYVKNSYDIGSDLDELERSTNILYSQLEDIKKTINSFMNDSNYIMRNDFDTKAIEYICAVLGALSIFKTSPNTNLKAQYLYTTKNYYRDSYSDFMLAGSQPNDQFTQEEIDQFLKAREQTIEIYENLNPEDAEKMDKLFKKMANDKYDDYSTDIQNIKYIVYTADEPYGSVFLEYIDDIKIGDYDYDDGEHFRSFSNKIFIDINNENNGANNPRGPYATFFHEIGHGIDDVSEKKYDLNFFNSEDAKDYYTTDTYKNDNGQTLQEVACQDVRDAIYNKVDEVTNFSMSEAGINNITDRLMGPSTPHDYYRSILSVVVKKKLNLSGPDNTLASDVYGGFTDNKMRGGYGHDKDYWYDSNGESLGKESKEFFAEGFSSAMIGNQSAINSQKENFPEAYDMFTDMVEEINIE